MAAAGSLPATAAAAAAPKLCVWWTHTSSSAELRQQWRQAGSGLARPFRHPQGTGAASELPSAERLWLSDAQARINIFTRMIRLTCRLALSGSFNGDASISKSSGGGQR